MQIVTGKTKRVRVKAFDANDAEVPVAGLAITFGGTDAKIDVAQDWGNPAQAVITAKGPLGNSEITASVTGVNGTEPVEVVTNIVRVAVEEVPA